MSNVQRGNELEVEEKSYLINIFEKMLCSKGAEEVAP
jgi:hypothetical protein